MSAEKFGSFFMMKVLVKCGRELWYELHIYSCSFVSLSVKQEIIEKLDRSRATSRKHDPNFQNVLFIQKVKLCLSNMHGDEIKLQINYSTLLHITLLRRISFIKLYN